MCVWLSHPVGEIEESDFLGEFTADGGNVSSLSYGLLVLGNGEG